MFNIFKKKSKKETPGMIRTYDTVVVPRVEVPKTEVKRTPIKRIKLSEDFEECGAQLDVILGDRNAKLCFESDGLYAEWYA